MKVRVDSKEMTDVVRGITKFTAITGSPASESILLRVDGEFLTLRATTFSMDAVLPVNIIGEPEGGFVVVPASLLLGAIYDSGSMLDITTQGKKLVATYEDGTVTKISLSQAEADDFPSLVEVKHLVTLPDRVLKTAVAHCDISMGARPISAAVHVIPGDGGNCIVGTDGAVGYKYAWEGESILATSLDAKLLSMAMVPMDEMVVVGSSENRVQIASGQWPAIIQFPAFASPSPERLPDMFGLDTAEPFTMQVSALNSLAFHASRAQAVDPDASLLIEPDGGLHIIGQGLSIRSTIEMGGQPLRSTFAARHLAASLKNIPPYSGPYIVSVAGFKDTDTARTWYFEGVGKHFITCAISTAFDE